MTMRNSGRNAPDTTATAGTADQEHRWEDHANTYRSDWENRYGASRPWVDHEQAYRYGWESARDSRHRGRDFTGAAPELEAGWPLRYDRAGAGYFGDNPEDREAARESLDRASHRARDEDWPQAGPQDGDWERLKGTVREGFERARTDFDQRA
jgi:hypothetical protein